MTIWAAGSGEEESPLLTWKAHAGWIGEIQFVPPPLAASVSRPSPMPLLTVSNDGSLILWDLNMTKSNRAVALAESDTGTKGVFTMHERGGLILSGGKDHSIRMTQMTAADLRVVNTWDGIYGATVKSARWRDGNVFAVAGGFSGASDILLIDRRQPTSPALTISCAHPLPINSLNWSPLDDQLLLSSGFDAAIRMHDVRSPGAAMCLLRGHTSTRNKGMHEPTFCDGGRRVAAVGDGSTALSVYCARTGTAVSRGQLNVDLNKGGSTMHLVGGSTLLLAQGAHVVSFSPVY